MIDIDKVVYLLEEKLDVLTETQLEYLVENRIDFIKNAVKDKISTAHDPESAAMSSDAIVDHIANKIDTTKNKSHTQWLVNRYKAGDFKLSGAKDIKKLMSSYEDNKQHLETSDINQHKSVSHLKDSLATLKTKLKRINEAAEDDKIDGEASHGMKVVWREGDNVGYKLPNKTVSIKNYGPDGKLAKTVWCTASNSTNNLFNDYNYRGGKYPLHLDNGHVIQLNHASGQLMDVNNDPVRLADPRFKDHAEIISKHVKLTSEMEKNPDSSLIEKYVKSEPHEVDAAFEAHRNALEEYRKDVGSYSKGKAVNHALDHIQSLVHKSSISDSQFEQLGNLSQVDTWLDTIKPVNIQREIVHSIFAKPEQLVHVASKVDDMEPQQYRALFEHHNTTPAVHTAAIDRLLHPDVSETQRTDIANVIAGSGNNVLPEHFHRIAHLHGVKASAVSNKNSKAPDEFFHTLKDSHEPLMSDNPHIPADVAEHIAKNTTDAQSLTKLLQNHKVPPSTIHAAIDRTPVKVNNLRHVLSHPAFTQEDVSKVVDHALNGRIDTSATWLNSTRLSKADIAKVLNHPKLHSLYMQKYGTTILDNPKVKTSDLMDIVNRDSFKADSDDHYTAVLKSHAIKPAVIDALIAKGATKSRNFSADLLEKVDHQHITPAHLHAILDSDVTAPSVKHQVFFHPSVQLSHFEKLQDNPRFHGAITKSENAPPSILHRLATSPMDHVRANIANNANTEKITHDILKTDNVEDIAKVSSKKAK